jgi:hypothetical protein
MSDDTSKRVFDRLAPERSGSATSRLLSDMTAIHDEFIAEMIHADSDGTALRAAGYTAIADAIDQRAEKWALDSIS